MRAFLPLYVLVGVLAAWQWLPEELGVPDFIFPKFSLVVEKFTSVETLRLLLSNSWTTLFEAFLGLVLGAASGILAGFLLAESDVLRRAFYPYLIALQSLPKVAVAPLFVIWFGFGLAPKVLIVALLCFFPLLVNTMSGVMGVDANRLDLFRSLCASRLQVWRRLLLPTSLPSIFAGLEVAVVFSLLGAIVGEFVSADSGLGVVLQQQQNNYDTAGVFAVLLILCALGVALNQSVAWLRRRVLFWQTANK
ncbi:NitT/TauT family transport system permease protein [Spinactinospora alkalitolerans]|uniref:NitT/TauT family transport system permease protein n=1 Tax=Spinactinospora alkalitolerans TaxID=687207 RepID=A0A852TRZ7_9ACTN|nr:ABC transporter permease [Spinactinospora alkalitolerans]NYE47166.1 NitT/TauT family transport system permease protein [Spinactinospora alkalitolerans]